MPYRVDTAVRGLTADGLVSWLAEHAEEVHYRISAHGAILFRETKVRTAKEFEQVCRSRTPVLMSYVGGGSPRKQLGGSVYTSTEYSQDLSIQLHCEAAYLPEMPTRVWFFCQTPPSERGETTLGDMRLVEARLSSELVDRFRRRSVLYVSNFHGGLGFGKSWMDVYETNDRVAVEQRLREIGGEFTWKSDGSLRVQLRAPATRIHSSNRQEIWVSQAANWHPLGVGDDHFNRMLHIYGDPSNFPTMAFYGDGTLIEPGDIREMSEALNAEETIFTWRPGDILLIDNEVIAHGRRPFVGSRRICVALA